MVQKAFLASSNFVNYIELGKKSVTGYYLEAKIQNDEFMVSGILYSSTGKLACKLMNNQVEQIQGQCRTVLDPAPSKGYKVVDPNGESIIELFLKDENTCILKGTVYDEKGTLIARGDDNDFLIFKGPAVLGKSNGSRGIVLE